MTADHAINRERATDKLTWRYAHVGLYDVKTRHIWIARPDSGHDPLRLSHAGLLIGGSTTTSIVGKDRFVCYWYHTPRTGQGLVHGYPIEWDEAHLMIRLDPTWNYLTQNLIPASDTTRVERNIEQQFRWGRRIFDAYATLLPKHALSWHLIGPRPSDCMFYIARHESS